MPFLKGENPHRPAPGSVLKVEPIRDKRAIGRIKKMLRDHPRDLCLLVLGMNTPSFSNGTKNNAKLKSTAMTGFQKGSSRQIM